MSEARKEKVWNLRQKGLSYKEISDSIGVPVAAVKDDLDVMKDIRRNWTDYKLPKINFVEADDWVGMYIDGRLFMEGHSLTYWEVLGALGIEYSRKEAYDQLEALGRCPDDLSEVVFDKE